MRLAPAVELLLLDSKRLASSVETLPPDSRRLASSVETLPPDAEQPPELCGHNAEKIRKSIRIHLGKHL